MTEFLVKRFVRNYQDVKSPKVRSQYGILTSIIGMICNFILFTVKFFVGSMIQSISVTADAFNNLSDATSSVISFIGVKLSSRPADREHPFGHGRYEYIAGVVVAFLVFQVGISCFKSSWEKILNPTEVTFSPVLTGILLLSIFVKVWLSLLNRKLGKRIESTMMKATSADAFFDVLITSATVISLLVSHFTGWICDGYMGLLVSLFVLYAGFNIIKDTLEPLIGQAVDPKQYRMIKEFVENHEGIVGSHDLIVHNYGPTNTMATIHAEVPRDVDIELSHEIIDKIELAAKKELGIFLVIHMDPIAVDNPLVIEKQEKIKEIVAELSCEASLHDFRLVNGKGQINLIFDLVVPYECEGNIKVELVEEINRKVWEWDNKCNCVITVEHSYIGKEQ